MRLIVIITSTLISVVACRSDKKSSCEIDLEFKTKFENCIKIAKLRAEVDTITDLATMSRAFGCLQVLTGHENSASWDEVGFGMYDNQAVFERDKKIWMDWYEKNKCYMTMDSAQKIFVKNRRALPNYKDPKELEKVISGVPENERDSAIKKDSIIHIKYMIDWPEIEINRP
jgi:hypothetical protein